MYQIRYSEGLEMVQKNQETRQDCNRAWPGFLDGSCVIFVRDHGQVDQIYKIDQSALRVRHTLASLPIGDVKVATCNRKS